jgi:hypothetical protein
VTTFLPRSVLTHRRGFVPNKATPRQVSLLAVLTLLSRQHVATRKFGTWLKLRQKTMFLLVLPPQKPLSSIFFAAWRCLSGLIEWLFLLRQGFGRFKF